MTAWAGQVLAHVRSLGAGAADATRASVQGEPPQKLCLTVSFVKLRKKVSVGGGGGGWTDRIHKAPPEPVLLEDMSQNQGLWAARGWP